MTNAMTISETAGKVRAAVSAAGLPVHVHAANGTIHFTASGQNGRNDAADLKAAFAAARPILLACGRKVAWQTRRGFRFFRVGESGLTLAAAVKLEMNEAETTSVLLGRHNMGTSL